MSEQKVSLLLKECANQSTNCLYTSVSLFIWQKRARLWRQFFVIAPIVVGSLASVLLVFQDSGVVIKSVASMLTILAGAFPAIFVALNLDMHVAAIARSASEFTNLRDRFSQASIMHSDSEYEELREVFEGLMDRMDSARENSPAVPEWCFEEARVKIDAGHYSHS